MRATPQGNYRAVVPGGVAVRLTGRMLMVGLTGGIGSGKSAVAARLAAHGAVVIDADVLAREAVVPGTDGFAEVVAAFGPDVLASDGTLDRPALGRRVFGDDAARRRLEAIVHPRVRARTAELVAAAPPDAVVVNDVPLLVEAGLAGAYEVVVVVLADEESRVARLVRDRGMTREDALARIRAQATDDQRRAVADVVVVNNGTLDDLRTRVDEVWRELAARGAG
jgi:dephospho-CoA kinase